MPVQKKKNVSVSAAQSRIPSLRSAENKVEGPQVKRSSSPPHGAPKKRTAFIDITNAHKVGFNFPGRKKKKEVVKKISSSSSSSSSSSVKRHNNPKTSSVSSEKEKSDEEETPEVAAAPVEELEVAAPSAVKLVPSHLIRQEIPVEFDIDSENSDDIFMCPEYAKDIFDYLKRREEKFVLDNYMHKQPTLSTEMRAILVDWLVEVQENFELYHETLYLAVKLTDQYLSQTVIQREMLQLLGSTCMLIASKLEERSPPCVDDFLYICDDAYKKEELITMECNILQTLSFDINIPIPYRFLRRYAKCVNAGMDTLTLARFYCELSLLDMDLVTERGSALASACLLMALLSKDLGGWSPILQFHSGYQLSDLAPVVRKLYITLSAPPDEKLKAVRNKYSHKVFFEVASLPLMKLDVLEKALRQ
ncbi:G2/mitotic-specific cyclin-B3 [Cynoglossus semilaevis]|uniref:G2/mitotic-specific cyclin-B2 n=1 Tax=Cynoglossus semilaevis TaxID=244447 RepID=A0A3P8UBM4_CYNSE|nr:G2/mitotic-specific cyclin-B3 [Cynoglossus semilaevis]